MKELNRTISVLLITAFLLSGMGPAVVSATPISESSVGKLNTVDIVYLDTSSDHPQAMAPSWPSTWIWIQWDPNEDGTADDYRDVENAYYQVDDYLYLRLENRADAAFRQTNGQEARYKWFIDITGDMSLTGHSFVDAEYMLFVEDRNKDGTGEVYLLTDTDADGKFTEYEGPPNSYYYDLSYPPGGLVTDTAIANQDNWSVCGLMGCTRPDRRPLFLLCNLGY